MIFNIFEAKYPFACQGLTMASIEVDDVELSAEDALALLVKAHAPTLKQKPVKVKLTPEQHEEKLRKTEALEDLKQLEENLQIIGNNPDIKDYIICSKDSSYNPLKLETTGVLSMFSRMTSYTPRRGGKPQKQRMISIFCSAYIFEMLRKICFTERAKGGGKDLQLNFLKTLVDGNKMIGNRLGVIYSIHEPSQSINLIFNIGHKDCPMTKDRPEIISEFIKFVNNFIPYRVILQSDDEAVMEDFNKYFESAYEYGLLTGYEYLETKSRFEVSINPNSSYSDIQDIVLTINDYCGTKNVKTISPFTDIFNLDLACARTGLRLMSFNDTNFPTADMPLKFDDAAMDDMKFPSWVKSVIAFNPEVYPLVTVAVFSSKAYKLEIVASHTGTHLRTQDGNIVPASNNPITMQIIDDPEQKCISFSFYKGVNTQVVYKLIVDILNTGVVV